jgi:hypothetical protein
MALLGCDAEYGNVENFTQMEPALIQRLEAGAGFDYNIFREHHCHQN